MRNVNNNSSLILCVLELTLTYDGVHTAENVENGKKGKPAWLYIDEFYVLLNSEYSAKYLQQFWKRVRKQGGLCAGITQNILANSEFVTLLKQANTEYCIQYVTYQVWFRGYSV